MSKRLKAVIDFYLYSNLHIALCAVAMVLVSQLIFGYRLRIELFVFVFSGTFFLYNLQRLPAAFANTFIESEFTRHKWNTDHKVFLAVISAITAVAAGWSFFLLYQRSQIVALLPAALSFAYAFPFIRLKGKWRRLREIEALKIFIIAIVWAIISTMLPATANDPTGKAWLTFPIILWFVACAAMIFSITIPFDIRDLHYDGGKLRTLPAILGVKKAILLALIALGISTVLVGVIALYYEFGGVPVFAAYFLWSIITGILIAKSTPQRPEYYFSFIMDGVMILLGKECFHKVSIPRSIAVTLPHPRRLHEIPRSEPRPQAAARCSRRFGSRSQWGRKEHRPQVRSLDVSPGLATGGREECRRNFATAGCSCTATFRLCRSSN